MFLDFLGIYFQFRLLYLLDSPVTFQILVLIF